MKTLSSVLEFVQKVDLLAVTTLFPTIFKHSFEMVAAKLQKMFVGMDELSLQHELDVTSFLNYSHIYSYK